LVMLATCSRYAPFVPVPNIAPRTHPPAVYARERAVPTVWIPAYQHQYLWYKWGKNKQAYVVYKGDALDV
jgi:hypothetical protein